MYILIVIDYMTIVIDYITYIRDYMTNICMYCDQIYGYRLNSYNYCMTIVIDYTGVNYMVIESYRAFMKISTLY